MTERKPHKGLENLKGIAELLLVPSSGVIAGMAARKELKDPIMSSLFIAGLEYTKFCLYAEVFGKLSTYVC